jgi:hypothetical protein
VLLPDAKIKKDFRLQRAKTATKVTLNSDVEVPKGVPQASVSIMCECESLRTRNPEGQVLFG